MSVTPIYPVVYRDPRDAERIASLEDEIAALREREERLKEALQPFAAFGYAIVATAPTVRIIEGEGGPFVATRKPWRVDVRLNADGSRTEFPIWEDWRVYTASEAKKLGLTTSTREEADRGE